MSAFLENSHIYREYLIELQNNKAILIDATIHAREWISTPAATWLLTQLLTSEDPEVVNMSNNIDWFIIPVLNPDGFVYSHRIVREPKCDLCSNFLNFIFLPM